MIGATVDAAKRGFFNTPRVMAAVDKAERARLSQFGAFVRRTARSSMRRSKNPSKPGRPPNAHTGLLKSKLFFAYEPNAHSVITGPALLNGTAARIRASRQTGPELLEEGGPASLSFLKWGPGRTLTREQKSIFVEPRPYMKPAFDANLPKAAELWRDSVKA